MTYADLLQHTLRRDLLCEADHGTLPNELEVQALWFSGLLGEKFTTNHGQKVTILSPGEWNRGSGPDFHKAAIEIDGKTLDGPLELDLDAHHWELHGHHQNENFDPVILHVVITEPSQATFTRTSKNRDIPRISIPTETVLKALGKPRLTQALARPGACLTPLAQLSDDAIHSLLQEAAQHRATQKATRHQTIARARGKSQALWEAFAESLGFARNRLPMRLLTQRLPISVLRNHTAEEIAAILFGTAGFLNPKLHQRAPQDSRQWLESLWETWWKLRHDYELAPELQLPWNFTASRPGNHPHRRLAALAQAATHWPSLLRAASESSPFSSFQKRALSLAHPFWNHHHTLISKATAKPLALLGKSRLQEFLINTLYPLSLHEREESWADYQKIPGGTPNQKVRRCVERLFGSKSQAQPHLKKAWQHQALLQIYQDFCLQDRGDCADCLFPTQLQNWQSP